MLPWLEFLAATAVILAAGYRLTRYGDIIAEKTGLSRLWLGMALMAAVTSLPELATGLSSVLAADLPDIAAGNIMGSCVFNVFILGLLDTLSRKIPLSAKSHQGNIFSAGMSLIFLGGVAVCLYLGAAFPRLGWVGLYTPAILVLYLATMRMAFKFEKRRTSTAAAKAALLYEQIALKRAVLGYMLNAAFVVGAAIFLPSIAEGIAEQTGLGQTFVGNIFVAISTSLPELVVSISAVRLGAIDMAVGNVFGSNLFNMAILALEDLFYFKGPLLSFVESQHLIPALLAMAMTGLAIAGLIYNAGKKYFIWAWDSFGIILLYLANLVLLYILR
ncbi:MAG: sodium:calcium antiporter [Candidatus Aminicenantes bacterium]|nr:sodium:calcium antiporter [Candidatus Aminicenantes bacterium]